MPAPSADRLARWAKIPREMRELPHWYVSRGTLKDKAPRSVDALHHPAFAHQELVGATTFARACDVAIELGWQIGFEFTDAVKLTAADIDNHEGDKLTAEEIQLQDDVFEQFSDCYTERSLSGNGWHIFVRGSIPGVVQTRGASFYSRDRFMICTGDVVIDAPMEFKQSTLDLVWVNWKSARPDVQESPTGGVEFYSDAQVVARGKSFRNGDVFTDLFEGRFEARYNGDQSKADHALIDLILYACAPSKDQRTEVEWEQVRRVFRSSELGQRKKAWRRDYIDRSIRKSLGLLEMEKRAAPKFSEAAIAAFIAKAARKEAAPLAQEAAVVSDQVVTNEAHDETSAEDVNTRDADYPPGFVGDLARFLFASSYKPLKEAAIVGALGIVAGITGRLYKTPTGKGGALYLCLLARTATGKEGISKGFGMLSRACKKYNPNVNLREFIGPEFASGQGLARVLAKRKCFVSVLGEFGHTLATVNHAKATGADLAYRKMLLEAYGKNEDHGAFMGVAYSKEDNDRDAIDVPALTIVAESTPETFFETLDESHVRTGLLPRFLIVEYKGERPDFNSNRAREVPQHIAVTLCSMVQTAHTALQNDTCDLIEVPFAREAWAAWNAFAKECDHDYKGIADELFTRAAENSMRIALDLAVANNPLGNPNNPLCVSLADVEWAIHYTRKSVATLADRFKKGDVGEGESKQMQVLIRVIEKYKALTPRERKDLKVNELAHSKGVITHSFFAHYASAHACFKKAAHGARNALKGAILEAIANETLGELTTNEKIASGCKGAAYRVLI